MKLMRRIHLYSGLFMFPWVLLYGFTGWFFNHPRYFTGDEVQSFAAMDVIDGQFSELPTAAEVAGQVVDKINDASDGPSVKLVRSEQARFNRFLTFTIDGEHQSHVVSVNPVTGDGCVRTTEKLHTDDPKEDVTPQNPLTAINHVQLPTNTQSKAAELVPLLLDELNLEPGEARIGRSSASVTFAALVDGKPSKVTYDMAKGSVSARMDSAPKSDMNIKSFLQRLHLSRGYTPNIETRTLWAVSVDAMFVSMVFWGISGIFMWWQIRRTRFFGGVTLVCSLICATLLTMGMHDEIASRSRRGRGEGKRAVSTRTSDSKRVHDKSDPKKGGSTGNNSR